MTVLEQWKWLQVKLDNASETFRWANEIKKISSYLPLFYLSETSLTSCGNAFHFQPFPIFILNNSTVEFICLFLFLCILDNGKLCHFL